VIGWAQKGPSTSKERSDEPGARDRQRRRRSGPSHHLDVRGGGVATGRHRHEFDYVVVPITGGTFKVIELAGSVRDMTQVAGSPYLGTAGTEHDVVSATDREAVFVEIELKR
jgi:beta-alanine degradation protein BauB